MTASPSDAKIKYFLNSCARPRLPNEIQSRPGALPNAFREPPAPPSAPAFARRGRRLPLRPPARCGETPAGSPSPRRPRRWERLRFPQPRPTPGAARPAPGRSALASRLPRPRPAGEARAAAAAARCRGATGPGPPLPQVGWFIPPASLRRTLQRIPPWAEPFRLEGRGVEVDRPLFALTPPPLRPAASRHPAAPRLPPPPARTALLTQLLPAGAVHLPAGGLSARPSANVEPAGAALRMRPAPRVAPRGSEPSIAAGKTRPAWGRAGVGPPGGVWQPAMLLDASWLMSCALLYPLTQQPSRCRVLC